MPDQFLDRLQFRLSLIEAELQRLLARVVALEAGTPLPPDQTVEIQPTAVHCTAQDAPSVPEQTRPKPVPLEVPELNILSGMGLTTGARRT